jgi:mannose-6-phosphate isomerase-like protein (cupin superfamily)
MKSTYVQTLDELPFYEQDSGPNITYQYVVKPGAMGLLSSGRVRLQGPTCKADDVHPDWDQLYIILKGAGVVLVAGEEHRVAAGHVVRVPRHTRHGVRLEKGESLEYVYVNAFASEEVLAKRVAAPPGK